MKQPAVVAMDAGLGEAGTTAWVRSGMTMVEYAKTLVREAAVVLEHSLGPRDGDPDALQGSVFFT